MAVWYRIGFLVSSETLYLVYGLSNYIIIIINKKMDTIN